MRRTIADVLRDARRCLHRVGPKAAARAAEKGALIVDIRPVEQRRADGEIPGALVIDRNVLEWRLDPASRRRVPEMTGYEQRVIVICKEGYSSSLAAATLQDLGLANSTDVIGDFRACKAAGMPVRQKAHSQRYGPAG